MLFVVVAFWDFERVVLLWREDGFLCKDTEDALCKICGIVSGLVKVLTCIICGTLCLLDAGR